MVHICRRSHRRPAWRPGAHGLHEEGVQSRESALLAGGGIRKGMVHGATDDFGYKAVQDPMDVHDLHATVLHQLGLDHQKLIYRHAGRDFRLTDVHGRVIHEILA